MMQRRIMRRCLPLLLVLLLAALAIPIGVAAAPANRSAGTYRNPLNIVIPGDGKVESCADPSTIYGQDKFWYMYCTTDPLNGADRNANGDLNFHFIPILRSADLVNWTYVGDAFGARPGWVGDSAGLWAPNIEYFNGQYYLYYTASDTDAGGSAIGVATGPTPAGPWTDSGAPVVEPGASGPGRWVFDPDVIQVGNTRYIYFGSYFGGVFVRKLTPDGLHSDPATQEMVAIDNRYEGANVVYHDGYYYLFVSATDCCRGPLTGYSVFAGRSENPTGPFVDREGVSLLAGRVGGTPVISMNGNRWVGTGHSFVFTDFSGQDWLLYHAIDRNDPYFEGTLNFTKRPVLLDPLDWVGGWPTVRGGQWASDTPQHAPAAQPGDKTNYKTKLVKEDRPGDLIEYLSDNFSGTTLRQGWEWVREPDTATAGLANGTFRFNTQAADLFEGSNSASVLTEPAPHGNYIVETRVKLNLPAEGCCFNYVQAGLVIYGDDDNFIKLVHVSIWNTRQTEFAKELFPVPAGYPRYGNTVVGPPDEWTYLRIAKRNSGGEELYTAYTSRDGEHWVRGGTWTHNLGNRARIGLVSMGRDPDPNAQQFTANFDYVRVYRAEH